MMAADRFTPRRSWPLRSNPPRSARLPDLPPLSIQAACSVSSSGSSRPNSLNGFAMMAPTSSGARRCMSSMMTPIMIALVSLTLPNCAPDRIAPLSRAPERLASVRSAPCRSAPVRSELVRLARMNLVPRMIASVMSVCMTKAFDTRARDRLAPRMVAQVSSVVSLTAAPLTEDMSPALPTWTRVPSRRSASSSMASLRIAPAQAGAAQVGPGHGGAGQVRQPHVGAVEIGIGQVGAEQARAEQLGAAEIRFGEVQPAEVQMGKVAHLEAGAGAAGLSLEKSPVSSTPGQSIPAGKAACAGYRRFRQKRRA